MYTYKAKVVRVVDGDTVYLEVDCGFYLKFTHSFRLYGVNAPELRDAQGPEARDWLIQELTNKPLLIDTYKADSFGRWLCTIFIHGEDNAVSVNQKLIDAGFAVQYTK
jgi:micrococcal nuclease